MKTKILNYAIYLFIYQTTRPSKPKSFAPRRGYKLFFNVENCLIYQIEHGSVFVHFKQLNS